MTKKHSFFNSNEKFKQIHLQSLFNYNSDKIHVNYEINMTEKLIISQLYQLPENLKVEVLHYIEFLKNKYNNQSTDKPHKRTFGSAAGKYKLSPDFNAPLEDFNEYM